MIILGYVLTALFLILRSFHVVDWPWWLAPVPVVLAYAICIPLVLFTDYGKTEEERRQS